MRVFWSGLCSLALGMLVASGAPAAPLPHHWAFQPIADARPPEIRDRSWGRTPIDSFIQAKQDGADLSPAVAADPRVLIRRMTFDLTGLPPAPSEVAAFVSSAQRDRTVALDALIERLLASPHYGERWGRWWLDVARYADTNGQDENKVQANAWRYRDWVVRSFNRNQPLTSSLSNKSLEICCLRLHPNRKISTA